MTDQEPEQQTDEQLAEETTELSIDEQIEALVSTEPEPDAQANTDTSEETDEPGEEEPPEIDYEQSIPMPDGREPMSLSSLKDRVIELERTEDKTIERENEIMRQSDQLANALQMAGGEIPPQLKQQMQTQQAAHLEREHGLMMQAIPEWKDPEVFKADRAEISKIGADYGLTPKELGAIMDHRVVKLLRDHSRLLKAQATAKGNLERLKAVPSKPGRKAPITTASGRLNKQIADAASGNDSAAKGAAIDALLNTG